MLASWLAANCAFPQQQTFNILNNSNNKANLMSRFVYDDSSDAQSAAKHNVHQHSRKIFIFYALLHTHRRVVVLYRLTCGASQKTGITNMKVKSTLFILTPSFCVNILSTLFLVGIFEKQSILLCLTIWVTLLARI